ncbi:UNVERIFIED_CONTAM: hypothetical protein FKN15_013328 [Acipenser sinensis]
MMYQHHQSPERETSISRAQRERVQHHQGPERESAKLPEPPRESLALPETQRESPTLPEPQGAKQQPGSKVAVGAVLASLPRSVERAEVQGSPDSGGTAVQDWHRVLGLVATLEPRESGPQPLTWSSHCVALKCAARTCPLLSSAWPPCKLPLRDQVNASRARKCLSGGQCHMHSAAVCRYGFVLAAL